MRFVTIDARHFHTIVGTVVTIATLQAIYNVRNGNVHLKIFTQPQHQIVVTQFGYER